MSLIKVYWIKSHPDYGYFTGDTGVIQSEKFNALFKGGYVSPLPNKEDKDPENSLPVDLPGRGILLKAGYDSLEKIQKAGDSIADLDLSKATVTKIKKYLAG